MGLRSQEQDMESRPADVGVGLTTQFPGGSKQPITSNLARLPSEGKSSFGPSMGVSDELANLATSNTMGRHTAGIRSCYDSSPRPEGGRWLRVRWRVSPS